MQLRWLFGIAISIGGAACGDEFTPSEAASTGGPLPSGSSGSGGAPGVGGAGAGGGGVCGDAVKGAAEACDGVDFGAASCGTEARSLGGTLSCTDACVIDSSGCEALPPAPRPRLPMNNAYVGSVHAAGTMRPTFKWASVESAEPDPALTYELTLARDRALTDVLTVETVQGTEFTPADDLPVSQVVPVGARYFWSVRACVGTTCTEPSPAWSVRVGRQRQDVNGDGHADMLAGNVNEVKLYLGSPSGFGQALPFDISEVGCQFIGDINDDGFGDMTTGDTNTVWVHLGAPGTQIAASSIPIEGPAAKEWYGKGIAGVGDVNGDGFDDLLIGDPLTDAPNDNAGTIWLYFGGSSFDIVPDATFQGPILGWFGHSADGTDVNGDGYSDLIVGAPYQYNADPSGNGSVELYLGSPTFDGSVMPQVLVGENNADKFGDELTAAGDLNGDGLGDFVVSAPGASATGRVYVFLGAEGAVGAPQSFDGSGTAEGFGQELTGGGDLDNDGFDDVILGHQYYPLDVFASDGAVYVIAGASSGVFTLGQPQTQDTLGLGSSVSFTGDVNGDGITDAILGAEAYKQGSNVVGQARLWFGGSLVCEADDVVTGVVGNSVGGIVN
ncbi:MAG: hypothetical protein WKG00_35245 [Polyangiaceae bacterium]